MTLKKIAICAAALVVATVTSHIALAGGKGGYPPPRQATRPCRVDRATQANPQTHLAIASEILGLQPRSWLPATRTARKSSRRETTEA